MAGICGIDWADEWHDVRVVNSETGELLVEERFPHDEAGIRRLLAALSEHEVERATIERPNGLLVGRLLAAGVTVVAIHPNQVKAARERFRAAGGKSDRFDAFVLCELCRTDAHRFPALCPQGDETLALQALCRTREDLVETRVGSTSCSSGCARRRSPSSVKPSSRRAAKSCSRSSPASSQWSRGSPS